ncbi:hypothetical protein BHE74_00047096, partial [Ensete ventricosum]
KENPNPLPLPVVAIVAPTQAIALRAASDKPYTWATAIAPWAVTSTGRRRCLSGVTWLIGGPPTGNVLIGDTSAGALGRRRPLRQAVWLHAIAHAGTLAAPGHPCRYPSVRTLADSKLGVISIGDQPP